MLCLLAFTGCQSVPTPSGGNAHLPGIIANTQARTPAKSPLTGRMSGANPPVLPKGSPPTPLPETTAHPGAEAGLPHATESSVQSMPNSLSGFMANTSPHLSETDGKPHSNLPTMLLAEDILLVHGDPFNKAGVMKQTAATTVTTVTGIGPTDKTGTPAPSDDGATVVTRPSQPTPVASTPGTATSILPANLLKPMPVPGNGTIGSNANSGNATTLAYAAVPTITVKGVISGVKGSLAILSDDASGITQTVRVGDITTLPALPSRVLQINPRYVLLMELGSHKRRWVPLPNIIGYHPSANSSSGQTSSTAPGKTGQSSLPVPVNTPQDASDGGGNDAAANILRLSGAGAPLLNIQPVKDGGP